MSELDPTTCPYCGSANAGCEHFFACIDATFLEVTGPASEVFNELGCSDEADGLTSDDMDDFVEVCNEACALCLDHDNEGGPGMSSKEYWCWSDNVARDLEKVREEMQRRRS